MPIDHTKGFLSGANDIAHRSAGRKKWAARVMCGCQNDFQLPATADWVLRLGMPNCEGRIMVQTTLIRNRQAKSCEAYPNIQKPNGANRFSTSNGPMPILTMQVPYFKSLVASLPVSNTYPSRADG